MSSPTCTRRLWLLCSHSVVRLCVTHRLRPSRLLCPQEWVAISSSRDLPGPGMEPAAPVLSGGFFTTEPPGKPITLDKDSLFFRIAFILGVLQLKKKREELLAVLRSGDQDVTHWQQGLWGFLGLCILQCLPAFTETAEPSHDSPPGPQRIFQVETQDFVKATVEEWASFWKLSY